MKALLFLFISILFYCKEEKKCDIFQKIFTDKKVEQYLHLDIENRNKLYLIENDSFVCNVKISEKLEIFTLSKDEIKNNLNYIELVSYKKINDKSSLITLNYPIEGVFFEIEIDTQNMTIKNIDIIEV